MYDKEETEQDRLNKLFKFKETLGKGAFGEVKSAIYLPENLEVAVKILEKQRICTSDSEVRMESFLVSLDHPNILKYFKVISFLIMTLRYINFLIRPILLWKNLKVALLWN